LYHASLRLGNQESGDLERGLPTQGSARSETPISTLAEGAGAAQYALDLD
jgi:hypothetical protein